MNLYTYGNEQTALNLLTKRVGEGILPLFSMLTLYCSTFFISVSAWPFQFNFSAPSLRSALKSPACSFAALLARFCMIDVHLNMTAFGGSQPEREKEEERELEMGKPILALVLFSLWQI